LQFFQSIGVIAGNAATRVVAVKISVLVAVHGLFSLAFCLSLRGTFSPERRGHSLVNDAPAPPEKMAIPVGHCPTDKPFIRKDVFSGQFWNGRVCIRDRANL
jgi:hypothetical protein